jgi:mRNA-degrading endonuclease RelE of RelBE toxin-antitoxin system
MAAGPFLGDVRALQGWEWEGVFRRRMGDYRLLFTVDQNQRKIVVQQISRRSGKTYG